jgi:hypothetical protein
MSFLNQLKTQAKALQSERTAQDQLLDENLEKTEKAGKFVLFYLQDLARQLSVIQPPAPPFSLDGKVPWPAMKLVDFRADARRKMLRNREVIDTMALGWEVVPQVGDPIGGVVAVNFPTEQQRVETRLAVGLVKHERKEIRHPEKNVLQELRYAYITQTRGSVNVTTDHERAQLHFRLVNTSGFEVLETAWPVDRIGHDLMDELAKRVVGQESSFA